MADDNRRDTRADHLVSHRWKPGQHGGGRGKKAYTAEEREGIALAKKAVPGAIKTLIQVMLTGSNSDKVGAATVLLKMLYPKGIPPELLLGTEVDGAAKVVLDLRGATTEQLQVVKALGIAVEAPPEAPPRDNGLDS